MKRQLLRCLAQGCFQLTSSHAPVCRVCWLPHGPFLTSLLAEPSPPSELGASSDSPAFKCPTEGVNEAPPGSSHSPGGAWLSSVNPSDTLALGPSPTLLTPFHLPPRWHSLRSPSRSFSNPSSVLGGWVQVFQPRLQSPRADATQPQPWEKPC